MNNVYLFERDSHEISSFILVVGFEKCMKTSGLKYANELPEAKSRHADYMTELFSYTWTSD